MLQRFLDLRGGSGTWIHGHWEADPGREKRIDTHKIRTGTFEALDREALCPRLAGALPGKKVVLIFDNALCISP